ncbi:hypothetical protein [Catellatospora coxensis]|uniref:Uncharacterized protein n=1 Tax=Catellatospora coxensis TaxID=310354 RepID=A0A8J3PCX9_9ACTN|nr:hypothetical protein [Catellatospora coxensis]GIG10466.1 hypothetical protein Cco03nite_71660 [Catellatospora coxensis]
MTREGSSLPDWMRKDAEPVRTTLYWRVTQWFSRSPWFGGAWRAVRDRPRLSRRFPRTYAVMAWLFAVAIAFFLGYKIIEYYNLIMAGKV